MKSTSLNCFADEVLQIMPLMVREFARREDNPLFHGQISCPQMVVLQHTVERGEQKMSDIANMISTKKSSASVLVDRLVKQKMVRRRTDKSDRRVIWISATPKGKKVVEQILRQKKESFKAIFGTLKESEREKYLSVLRKVKTNLLKSVSSAALAVIIFGISSAWAFDIPFLPKKKQADQRAVEVGSASSKSEQKKPVSLNDMFEMSLKQSEKIGIVSEEIALAQARFYRSFDYFLPTVSFQMTRFEQDVDEDASSSSGAFDFSRRVTPAKKFVFSQPLFSGFKEIAVLQGSGADKKEQKLKLYRAKQTLFVDVMEAYYTALHAQKDVEVFNKIHDALAERLKDLKERVDLGRSRESEYKSSIAELKILESDRIQAKKDARNAISLLEFYCGRDLSGYHLLEDNGEALNGAIPDLTLSQTRPDVSALEQAYIVAQKKVIAANAHFFPEVSLDGNYYTQRKGFQNGNDWDVTLRFDVPVFEVGQTLGDVKEAASNREKARLAWEQSKRLAYLDAKNAFEDYQTSVEAEKSYFEAKSASNENYEILVADFKSNLVNNLEVLDSLRRTLDVERGYEASHYSAKKNYWKLKLALGEIEIP